MMMSNICIDVNLLLVEEFVVCLFGKKGCKLQKPPSLLLKPLDPKITVMKMKVFKNNLEKGGKKEREKEKKTGQNKIFYACLLLLILIAPTGMTLCGTVP